MPGGGIFISYRRDDTAGFAGRLYDRLAQRFGANRIFMDIDTIAPGHEFATDIDQALANCDACVVLIGRDWLTITGADGGRRLDDPTDFVRLEIATAIRHGVRVLPVLVDKASAPSSASLPDDIRPLAGRQAIELSNERWNYDTSRLLLALEGAPRPPWWKRPAAIAAGALLVVAVAVVAVLAGRPSDDGGGGGGGGGATGSDGGGAVPLLEGTYDVTMRLETMPRGPGEFNTLWEEPSPVIGESSDKWDPQTWIFSHDTWRVKERPDAIKGSKQSDGTYLDLGDAHCSADRDDTVQSTRHLFPTSTDPSDRAAETFTGTLRIHWECENTEPFDATFGIEGTRIS
jgi:hypothetical protein